MSTSGEDEDIERSVDLVMFRTSADGYVSPVGSDLTIRLTESTTLASEMVSALLDATVNLRTPGDAPPELVEAIADSATPDLFLTSPWLREHKAAVFVDDRCVFGAHVLRYQEHLGLAVEES